MKRILFVDDDPTVLTGLRRMLEPHFARWQMQFVHSAQHALDVLELESIDLIFADVQMPGMDGIALLHQVQTAYPQTARVLLSGQPEVGLASRASSVAYRVLTKPFPAAQLVATIERLCTLQDLFCTPELRRTIGRIGGLPSLSSTFNELSLAVQDPTSSIADVAVIIERDISMAAKVLQLVNSGFFGLSQTMTSVKTAVSYLGVDTIKNLALASETFTIFVPDPCIPRGFLEALHRRREQTALVLGALPLRIRDRDPAIVSALLLDIGELILASKMPFQFSAVLAAARERSCPRYEAEQALIGITHAELGAYLLGVWGISGLTVEAVAHHHRPLRIPHEGLDSAAAVYLAALLVEDLDSDPQSRDGLALRERDREDLKQLGLAEQYPLLRARALKALQAGRSAAPPAGQPNFSKRPA